MKTQNASQSGFTLLEVVFAFFILMVVSIGVSGLFVYAVRYNTGADDRAIAIAIAEERLEEIRSLPFNHALLNQTTTGSPAALTWIAYDPDPTERVGRRYRVERQVENVSTSLKKVSVRVRPLGANGSWGQGVVQVVTYRAATSSGPYL